MAKKFSFKTFDESKCLSRGKPLNIIINTFFFAFCRLSEALPWIILQELIAGDIQVWFQGRFKPNTIVTLCNIDDDTTVLGMEIWAEI